MIAHLTFTQLLQLVQNSGGAEVNAQQWSQQERVQLAANAAASGARLVFHNSNGMTHEEMLQVARNAKGLVVFA